MHVEINLDPPPPGIHLGFYTIIGTMCNYCPFLVFAYSFFLVTASVFSASEPLTGGALPRSFPRREWRTVGVVGRLRRLRLVLS